MGDFFSILQGVVALLVSSLAIGITTWKIFRWIFKKPGPPFNKNEMIQWIVGCIVILLITFCFFISPRILGPLIILPTPASGRAIPTVSSTSITSIISSGTSTPPLGVTASVIPVPSSTSSHPSTSTPIPIATVSSLAIKQKNSIIAPGCYGDNSLQGGQNIAFRCPPQNSGTANPYNDFQAKDENLALADTTQNPFTLTGTIGVQSNTSCSLGCIVQGNILFHDEPADFRQATSFGIIFAGYGIALDRGGQVYLINRNMQGGSTTSLEVLTNFPTGNDLVANDNPINVQIQYVPGRNVFFQVSYKSGGQLLKTSIDSGISSVNLNIGKYNSSNILEVFVQNIVNPNQYSGEFQHSPIDFGDSSIIGLGEITITSN